jgi:predicted glycoside hydrolase/deacetylase ChbG (UPF0249 family)
MDLCLTADDYGYTPGSCEAILDLAEAGRVSAASVMAHRDSDLSGVQRLARTGIAVGLHLCFTEARPLASGLGTRLPARYRDLFAAIAARPWMIARLYAEARAQADRLRDAGVAVDFVNGHEHVHLFPPLWPIARDLARRLGARAVRAALGQRVEPSRAGALAAASRAAWALAPIPGAVVLSPIGLGLSGSPTVAAVEALLARPFAGGPGVVREIYVHPSRDEPGRRAEHALVASGEIARIAERRGLRVTRGIPR